MKGRKPVKVHRMTRRIPLGNPVRRLRIFAFVMALVLAITVLRSVQLQAFDSDAYAASAAKKMQYTTPLLPKRGTITARDGVVLAASEPAVNVIADPEMIKINGADLRYEMTEKKKAKAAQAPGAISEILATHLGGEAEDYLPKLTVPGSKYQVIAKQVPSYTYSQIAKDMQEGKWHGIFSEHVSIRTYPNGTLAANVLGFVNAEGEGVAGLEQAYQKELAGEAGKLTYDSSAWGRIPLGTNVLVPAEDGVSYELTIDSELQYMTQRALANGVAHARADSGMAIVTDVKTGEILAIATVPTFDPANTKGHTMNELGNRLVQFTYEPGSVQKVLTMAALTDSGLAKPDTHVTVPARLNSGGRFIKDSFSHNGLRLTARGVIAQSSNIGIAQMTRELEKAKLTEYLSGFGLGKKTGLGLPGEAVGSIPGEDMPDYTRDQISFGQGLSVTAVQMAGAVGAIANDGVYVQPRLIRKAVDGEGNELEIPEPETHRVISSEAAQMTLDMMEAVVTLKDSRGIANYRTGGKTGTAQRYEPKCKCYSGYVSSYVTVAPLEDPQLLVYVVMDKPKGQTAGSAIALPVAREIMTVALPRYGVLPSESAPQKKPLTF